MRNVSNAFSSPLSRWMVLMGRLDLMIESSIVLTSCFCKHLREFAQSRMIPKAAPEIRFPRSGRLQKRRPPLSPAEFSRPTTARRNSKSRAEEDRSFRRCEWERRSRPIAGRGMSPRDFAFCACTLCADCAAIGIVDEETMNL